MTNNPNVELIKKFYIAFKKQNKQFYLQLCDEKIEWISMDGMPNGGKYMGKDAVFYEYFPNMLSNFKEFHAEPTKFLSVKNMVIVFGRYRGLSVFNKKFDVPFSHVYTIKNKKIIQFQQFTDTKKIQDSLTN